MDTIFQIYLGIMLYMLVGQIYGFYCATTKPCNHKMNCSPTSKQGIKIILFSPYYILKEIIKGDL